jgi:1,4-alpha-glucan branching enzyme
MSGRSGAVRDVAVVADTALIPVSNAPADAAGVVLRETQFIMVDPTATSVTVVGHFNDWDLAATPMTFDSVHGAWSVTIPLPPGRHEFQYVIDGVKRVNDPTLPQVSSDFGSPNSVITVYPKE